MGEGVGLPLPLGRGRLESEPYKGPPARCGDPGRPQLTSSFPEAIWFRVLEGRVPLQVPHEGLAWQGPRKLPELKSVNRLLGLGSGQGLDLVRGWFSGAECQASSDSVCESVGLKHGHIPQGLLRWPLVIQGPQSQVVGGQRPGVPGHMSTQLARTELCSAPGCVLGHRVPPG